MENSAPGPNIGTPPEVVFADEKPKKRLNLRAVDWNVLLSAFLRAITGSALFIARVVVAPVVPSGEKWRVVGGPRTISDVGRERTIVLLEVDRSTTELAKPGALLRIVAALTLVALLHEECDTVSIDTGAGSQIT